MVREKQKLRRGIVMVAGAARSRRRRRGLHRARPRDRAGAPNRQGRAPTTRTERAPTRTPLANDDARFAGRTAPAATTRRAAGATATAILTSTCVLRGVGKDPNRAFF